MANYSYKNFLLKPTC